MCRRFGKGLDVPLLRSSRRSSISRVDGPEDVKGAFGLLLSFGVRES